MSSMEEYDKMKAGLIGAPLTDLDGHPLDTGVDDHDEEQSTDAEYAAFQHARNRQQFRLQKPATTPDDGLSDEANVRAKERRAEARQDATV